jgi:hypothetical protein
MLILCSITLRIAVDYMRWVLPVAVIVLLILMICSHAHFIRRIESFGVNAGYYLSGDGGWAGQMHPAAASADGDTGLVPAPKAGQQNSYLRGDGTWQQANNAPTAAHYLFTTTTEDQDTGSADTYLIKYPMSGSGVISSNSTVITQPNATTFVLQPGYAYKCTAGVTLATDTGTYLNALQFCSTTGVPYGVPGSILSTTSADVNNICTNSTAIAYIAPTTPLTLNVRFTNRSKNNILTGIVSTFLIKLGVPQIPGGTWVSIEVISNNNTITAFAGATSTTNGFIGYIPAPLAGQQNHVLTGDSKWSPAINAHTRIVAAGKQNIMFTNIPAYVTRLTVILDNIKINSAQIPILQLGSGRIQTDNYMASVTYLGTSASGGGYFTDGFRVTSTSGSGDIRNGYYVLVTTPGTNVWICTGTFGSQNTFMTWCGGRVELPRALDQLKVSTTNGSDLFATGTVNVLYE